MISQLQASIRASQEASLERDAALEKQRLAHDEAQKRLEAELAAARQEFASYKTRAQSILKHQQLVHESTTTTAASTGQSGSSSIAHPMTASKSQSSATAAAAVSSESVASPVSAASVAAQLQAAALQKEVEDARAQLALHVEECTHLRTENDRLSADTERWKTKYAQV